MKLRQAGLPFVIGFWLAVLLFLVPSYLLYRRHEQLKKDIISQRERLEAEVASVTESALARVQAILDEVRSEAGDLDTSLLSREDVLGFLSTLLNSLPDEAQLDLTFEDGDTHWLSELTIQNPAPFQLAGEEVSAEAIAFVTVPNAAGGLNIVLKLFDEPILDDGNAASQPAPAEDRVLLEDVFWWEWYALEPLDRMWLDSWDIRGRRPSQLRLNVKFDANDNPCDFYFPVAQAEVDRAAPPADQ